MNASFVSLKSVLHELNVFFLYVYDGHLLFVLFMHFIVILSEGVEIIGDDRFLLYFGGWVDFLDEALKDDILLGVIKSFCDKG